MTAMGSQSSFGIRRGRREPIDVPERKAEDKTLDKLVHVRKQRLERLERERREARESWRAARAELREAKERWRQKRQEATDFWKQARSEFFTMAISSGQFRKTKAVYERLKAEAADLRVACLEQVNTCRQAGTEFFKARLCVLQANRQQEKLSILRDEMRLRTIQSEM